MPMLDLPGTPPDTSATDPPDASPTTLALLSISQDLAAILSITVEASTSYAYQWFRFASGLVGMTQIVPYGTSGHSAHVSDQNDTGNGRAVVVVGGEEAIGQSLTIKLAKSGYTVFPFLSLPSPSTPPDSSALSTLLLRWSDIQKRLRHQHPRHSGNVVPVITDPNHQSPIRGWKAAKGKQGGRFAHAGETVRAYCKENKLVLVLVICAPIALRQRGGLPRPVPAPVLDDTAAQTPTVDHDELPSWDLEKIADFDLSAPLQMARLTNSNEQDLIEIYRQSILDPLSIIRDFSDLLSEPSFTGRGRGRGRLIIVNKDSLSDEGPMRMINAARGEMARVLREELNGGVDVCEVVTGPLVHRLTGTGMHLRHLSNASEEAVQSGQPSKRVMGATSDETEKMVVDTIVSGTEPILPSSLSLLSRICAVDDALLYSSVRRAVEDRYPRYKYLAGLSPLVESIPGSGTVRVLGRWVLGKLVGKT